MSKWEDEVMVKKKTKEKKTEVPQEKKKTVEQVTADLAKQYKRPVLFKASGFGIKRVSTGLMSVDDLFCGGVPKGRWSMIYGAKGAGKTSLVSKIIAVVQERGGKCVYVDAEHAFDPAYASAIGVDTDSLVYSRPRTLEEAATTVAKCAPAFDVVVLDSIVAIGTLQETERDLEQDTMAAIPRKLSQFFRTTNAIVGKSNAIVILVNQTRTNLSAFIPFDTFPGGNALAHYASIILQMRRGSHKDDPSMKVEDGKDKNGNVKYKTVPVSYTHLRAHET